MEQRVDALEQKLKALSVKFENYTKIEGNITEDEMYASLLEYVKSLHRFHINAAHPLAQVRELKDPETGKKLIEFDGILILESYKGAMQPREQWGMISPEDSSEKTRRKALNTMRRDMPTLPTERYVMILEAKHMVRESDVVEKIAQLTKLEGLIIDSKGPHKPRWTEAFKKLLTYTDLHTFDPNCYLIMGGQSWEPRAIERLRELSTQPQWQDRIGVMQFTGNRYSTHPFVNGVLQKGGAPRQVTTSVARPRRKVRWEDYM